jgi:HEAT repeat protein
LEGTATSQQEGKLDVSLNLRCDNGGGFGDESCLDGLLDVLTSNSSGSGTRVFALGRLHHFRKVSEGDFQRIAAVTLNALTDPEPDARIAASRAVSQFSAGIATPSLEKPIKAEKDEGVRSRMQLDLQRVQAQKGR